LPGHVRRNTRGWMTTPSGLGEKPRMTVATHLNYTQIEEILDSSLWNDVCMRRTAAPTARRLCPNGQRDHHCYRQPDESELHVANLPWHDSSHGPAPDQNRPRRFRPDD